MAVHTVHSTNVQCVDTVNPDGHAASRSLFCTDVNECWRGVCGKARCRNTPGSYQCICPDSFVFDNTLKKCVGK